MADDRDPDGPAPGSGPGANPDGPAPGAGGPGPGDDSAGPARGDASGRAPGGELDGPASGDAGGSGPGGDPAGHASGGGDGAVAGGPGSGPGPGPRDEPDQTREFDPFADEKQEAPTGAADTDPDRTAQIPAAGDVTRQTPAVDETAPMPAQPGAWSGRAGVRPPEAAPGPAPTEWVAPPEDGGRWWMPIVLGIVALLLLGGLIAGIWLIYDANRVERTPTPPSTPTIAPTSAPATTAAPATTSAPPPTTAPAGVAVPRLVGLTDEQARDELDRTGLSYRLVYRPAEEAPNTVIETDPPEGEVVPEGTEVTLVIASPLTPTDPSTDEPTPEPTPTS